ncbi:MAG: hydantoinase/oxoprolinase family protein [Desulfurococcales archaeon]|nr:hydantoinase/oxoprolinase family protein [Desulfurococcales archaeon]
MKVRIGIDVGSTHTDSVAIDESSNVIHAVKARTTADVTSGIVESLRKLLKEGGFSPSEVVAVMFGTTHILNAIVQRKGLGKVGVIRIGAPATTSIEPMLDWPSDLRGAVEAAKVIIRGGHEYTGEEIAPLDEEAVRKAAQRFAELGVDAVAISSVFSIVNPDHELRASEIVREFLNDVPVILSHEIGSMGLLERENATILNAASISVMRKAIQSLRQSLANLGIEEVPMFFAQNDGTTAKAEFIQRYPIFTVVAPISNSIRGAYVLTGIKDAIVVDTGGTTSNIGVLTNGYPREALEIEVGGVRTNIRSPDIVAVGLAGGSIVKVEGGEVTVGPVSVGYRLIEEGISWGGNTITATDIALAKGVMRIDDPACDPERAKQLIPGDVVEKAYDYMVRKLEESIDKVKTSAEPVTVILVGGGSLMWPRKLRGAKEVIRPEYAQSANALGAATALVGGMVEKAFSYDHVTREEAISQASDEARRKAVEAGADPATVEVVEVEEIALPYLPGNAVKIRVKAVGKLKL